MAGTKINMYKNKKNIRVIFLFDLVYIYLILSIYTLLHPPLYSFSFASSLFILFCILLSIYTILPSSLYLFSFASF